VTKSRRLIGCPQRGSHPIISSEEQHLCITANSAAECLLWVMSSKSRPEHNESAYTQLADVRADAR
jgi:hypothetical protein